MADPAIAAEGLGKRFGDVTALDGVDLELPAGSVLGVLGPNGAGKTTTVRILATLLRPDRGRARVAGFDVTRNPAAVRRLIGLSGQYAAVDPFLTGQENLIMIGRLYGLTRRQARRRAGDLTDVLDLASAAGRLVRTYSGGMRRRLDVAASLLAAPPVLFLDEPTTGLDPRGRLALWQVLSELTAEGTSLLLTTQYVEEAERLALCLGGPTTRPVLEAAAWVTGLLARHRPGRHACMYVPTFLEGIPLLTRFARWSAARAAIQTATLIVVAIAIAAGT